MSVDQWSSLSSPRKKRAFSKWGQTVLQLLYANEWHCASVKHEIVQLLLVQKEKWGGLQFMHSCACKEIIVVCAIKLLLGSAIFAWHLFLSCCSVPVATEEALLLLLLLIVILTLVSTLHVLQLQHDAFHGNWWVYMENVSHMFHFSYYAIHYRRSTSNH